MRSPNSPRATISASRPSAKRIRSPTRILRPGRTSASQSRPSARDGAQQEDLHLAAQVFVALRIVFADGQRADARAMAEQARGKDARIVEHQAVAGARGRTGNRGKRGLPSARSSR